MPGFALCPMQAAKPVAGLIAQGAQVKALCAKLGGRSGLQIVMGDDWLAVFSFIDEVHLPWLPDQPTYLYALAPGLLCETGLAPDMPVALWPGLVDRLSAQGAVAVTAGPTLWDFGAAKPVDQCNLQALL